VQSPYLFWHVVPCISHTHIDNVSFCAFTVVPTRNKKSVYPSHTLFNDQYPRNLGQPFPHDFQSSMTSILNIVTGQTKTLHVPFDTIPPSLPWTSLLLGFLKFCLHAVSVLVYNIVYYRNKAWNNVSVTIWCDHFSVCVLLYIRQMFW